RSCATRLPRPALGQPPRSGLPEDARRVGGGRRRPAPRLRGRTDALAVATTGVDRQGVAAARRGPGTGAGTPERRREQAHVPRVLRGPTDRSRAAWRPPDLVHRAGD